MIGWVNVNKEIQLLKQPKDQIFDQRWLKFKGKDLIRQFYFRVSDVHVFPTSELDLGVFCLWKISWLKFINSPVNRTGTMYGPWPLPWSLFTLWKVGVSESQDRPSSGSIRVTTGRTITSEHNEKVRWVGTWVGVSEELGPKDGRLRVKLETKDPPWVRLCLWDFNLTV